MADEYALNALVEHVRPFTHVLSALRLSKKQLVRVGVSDRGVTFVAVDDSKSLQAQANFRAETFAAFSANPAAAFSTHDRSARAALGPRSSRRLGRPSAFTTPKKHPVCACTAEFEDLSARTRFFATSLTRLKVGEVKFAPAGIGRSLVQFRAGAED